MARPGIEPRSLGPLAKTPTIMQMSGTTVKIKESGKRDKYLDLARELKKTMHYESNGDTNCNRCT